MIADAKPGAAGDGLKPRFEVGRTEEEIPHRDIAIERAAQHDDPVLRFPAGRRQLSALALPALAGIRPAGFPEVAPDMALDVLRELELEHQVRLLE